MVICTIILDKLIEAAKKKMIGIIVGCSFGLFLIILLTIFCILNRRRINTKWWIREKRGILSKI